VEVDEADRVLRLDVVGDELNLLGLEGVLAREVLGARVAVLDARAPLVAPVAIGVDADAARVLVDDLPRLAPKPGRRPRVLVAVAVQVGDDREIEVAQQRPDSGRLGVLKQPVGPVEGRARADPLPGVLAAQVDDLLLASALLGRGLADAEADQRPALGRLAEIDDGRQPRVDACEVAEEGALVLERAVGCVEGVAERDAAPPTTGVIAADGGGRCRRRC
jgi:hypothetical protein